MRAHRGLAVAWAVLGLLGGAGSIARAGVSIEAVDDAYVVEEDGSLSVPAPGVLANDPETEGGCAAVVGTDGPLGEVILAADGSFTFTPIPDFSGSTSFTYGFGILAEEACAEPFLDTATVTITVNPVNDAPTAVADSFQFLWGQTLNIGGPGVLANDDDVDGDQLTAVKVTNPAHGVVTLAADGGFSYTPATAPCPGQADAFSYRASDGSATSPVRIVLLNPAPLPCPTAFVPPSPTPTPATTEAPAVTEAPTPSAEVTSSPEPSPSPLPSPTSLGTASPAPTPVPGPVDAGGGPSLPVLLVVVLLGVLLVFGAAFYVPRLLARAGPDGPMDDGPLDDDEPGGDLDPR